MNAFVSSCLANVSYAKMILADIEDSRMAERPVGLNPPAWLLMHLAVTADHVTEMIGGTAVCPTDWNERASTKNSISDRRIDYPSRDELMQHYEAADQNACKWLNQASAEQLAAQQKLGFFERELPSVGEMAGFLLVAHHAIHLGQLSAWRRAMGKPPLF